MRRIFFGDPLSKSVRSVHGHMTFIFVCCLVKEKKTFLLASIKTLTYSKVVLKASSQFLFPIFFISLFI
jgi:hypothetical protein